MKNKVIQIKNQKSSRTKMNSQKDIIRINKKPISKQRSQDLHFEQKPDTKTDNGKPIYLFVLIL